MGVLGVSSSEALSGGVWKASGDILEMTVDIYKNRMFLSLYGRDRGPTLCVVC